MDIKTSCYYKSVCSAYQQKFVPGQVLASTFRDVCHADSKEALAEKYCPMHDLYSKMITMVTEEEKGVNNSLEKLSGVLKKTNVNLEQKLV